MHSCVYAFCVCVCIYMRVCVCVSDARACALTLAHMCAHIHRVCVCGRIMLKFYWHLDAPSSSIPRFFPPPLSPFPFLCVGFLCCYALGERIRRHRFACAFGARAPCPTYQLMQELRALQEHCGTDAYIYMHTYIRTHACVDIRI